MTVINIQDRLTEDSFLIYAVKNYQNPQCLSSNEFNEDIKILMYIKRLLRKYETTGQIKERLLINHIITLTNLFGNTASVRMLFFYCERNLYPQLKTIFEVLSIVPDKLPEARIKSLKLDKNLYKLLKEL